MNEPLPSGLPDFVADEEDQSPQTVNFYKNYFLSLKGFRNANLFSSHAIDGSSTGMATGSICSWTRKSNTAGRALRCRPSAWLR